MTILSVLRYALVPAATTIGVDVFLDRTLVGIAFAAGKREGLLVVGALTMEMLFLGLSATVSLERASRAGLMAVTAGLAGGSARASEPW